MKRPALVASTRFFLVAALLASTVAVDAQEGLELDAPEGWKGETIELPPGFAPDMKLRGVEELRFSPGMFDAESPAFFSYAFAFRIDAGPELTDETIRDEFLAYYRGLAKAVSGGSVEVGKFSLELRQAEPGKTGRASPSGVSTAVGQLTWVEPFVTKKSQTLRLEIDTWKSRAPGSSRRRFLFCSASPKASTAPIWGELRAIRDKFYRSTVAVSSSGGAGGNWPSFRGARASGVADGQKLPDRWGGDGADTSNVRWKTRIPGLAHSSPVIWGQNLFVTTAISSKSDASFRPGLYGAGDASKDRSPHRWVIYCLDKASGETRWERTATQGRPQEKRHIKATYANSTPATDGRHVVAFFGSQGLYAYDVAGDKLWQRDLGRLDVGAYDAPDYEWGSASSPIIHGDLVIVQCDTQAESFVLAANLETGETVWKTDRDELPSWGTPTVFTGPRGAELVTNGSNFIRGYDPTNGKELWRLGGSSKITAPTPIFEDGIIIVASGRAPERPIFALRAGARGDLTLADSSTTSAHVVWSKVRRGPYMPTPLIYRGALYVLNNNGLFDCYDFKTGEEIYRQRIPHGGSGFSASPVAADGKIYLSSEDGDVFVVKAGRKFELIAKNSMGEGELLMATPALSEGVLYVRSQRHLFAIGK